MDKCGFLWQRNFFSAKTPKNTHKKRESQYVIQPKNIAPSLQIDVQTPTQNTFVPQPQIGPKGQLREIFTNSNHKFHLKEFSSNNTTKAQSKHISIQDEVSIGDNDILKRRTRPINPKLPVIRDERPESTGRIRPKPRNLSVDYDQDRGLVEVDISLCIQPTQSTQKSKKEIDIPTAKRNNKPPKKPTKLQINKGRDENSDVKVTNGTQESFRTLTSVYRSKNNLMESFEDLFVSRNGDPDKIIREIVENNVERAYRRIDIIKKNFFKKNKKYLFHIASDF